MTAPTSNPVPSAAAADLLFNAERIDQAVNSSALAYTDRLGVSRMTLAGAVARISAVNTRGAWAAATAYAARDVVSNTGTWYIALDAHTSGATFAGDLSAHWRVYQGVLLSDLSDASIVGFTQPGTGAPASTVKKRLESFASDVELPSSFPCFGMVSVNATRTTINRHAFEDWSALNTTDTNQGYSSFDSKATLTNTLAQNHFVAYQARNIFNGSADLTAYMHGIGVAQSHTGAGTIATNVGVNISDISGTGPVTENIGLHIGAITRGSTNWSIYTEAGNVHHDGRVELSSGSNHSLKQGVAWVWTADGTLGGTVRGSIYADSSGTLNLSGGPGFSSTVTVNSGGAHVQGDLQLSGKFGANGVTPPARAAVNAAATDAATTQALVNQLRSALIAAGICI